MQTKGIIFSLVSRSRDTILTSYSLHPGNSRQIALEILKNCKLGDGVFGKFVVSNYNFITFSQRGFAFVAMTDSSYELRIVVKYLKDIAQKFFNKYSASTLNQSKEDELSSFRKVLKQQMRIYSQKHNVDNLYSLKYYLNQVEKQSLQNLDLVVQRSQKLQYLVQKSEEMSEISTDLLHAGKSVHRRMWWKNKKLLFGIAAGVLAITTTLLLLVVLL